MGCNKDVAPEATGPRHHEYNAGACHLCESQTLHFYKIIPTAQGSSHFQVMRYRARWELWFKNIKTATKGAPQVLPISQWKVELRMINTKTGTGLRFYSVCFSSKSRALEEQVGTIPSRRNASCRQWQMKRTALLGHRMVEGDPHPELERPLLSLPPCVSHHTWPLKM